MVLKITVSGVQDAKSAIAKELREFMKGSHFVTVGVHDDAGMHPDSSLTNAQVGAYNHFGTDRIPARPWLDVGVETGNEEYLKIIEEGLSNGEPLEMILERVGIVATGKVQDYMTLLSDPPNAPSTVRKKKSANPLIDTGALRQSVTSKVTAKKPSEGIS